MREWIQNKFGSFNYNLVAYYGTVPDAAEVHHLRQVQTQMHISLWEKYIVNCNKTINYTTHYRKWTNKIMLTACNALIFVVSVVMIAVTWAFIPSYWARYNEWGRKNHCDKWSNAIYVLFYVPCWMKCENDYLPTNRIATNEKCCKFVFNVFFFLPRFANSFRRH